MSERMDWIVLPNVLRDKFPEMVEALTLEGWHLANDAQNPQHKFDMFCWRERFVREPSVIGHTNLFIATARAFLAMRAARKETT